MCVLRKRKARSRQSTAWATSPSCLHSPTPRLAAETLKGIAVQLTNNPWQKVLRQDAGEVVDGQVSVTQDTGQELADQQTIKACEDRLRQIEEERESARYAGDVTKIDEVEVEEQKIRKFLSEVKDVRGKPRRVADKGRSMFNSVKQAVERAIRRIERADPPLPNLAAYLPETIEWANGTFEYRPSSPAPT